MIVQGEEVFLELIVASFNTNKGHNMELVQACKDLKDYVEYTHRVRTSQMRATPVSTGGEQGTSLSGGCQSPI